MQQIKSYTDKQILVESWINNIGFRTDLETVFGEYAVDIYIAELNIAVEVDGPCHKFKKRDKKRDDRLRTYHNLTDIIRVPVDITEKEFKRLFLSRASESIGENPFE